MGFFNEFQQIRGSTIESSLETGDRIRGLTNVSDGGFVLDLDLVVAVADGGRGRDVRAKPGRGDISTVNLDIIGKSGTALGHNIDDVASSPNTDLVLIHDLAGPEVPKISPIDVGGGLVAQIVAGVDGFGLAYGDGTICNTFITTSFSRGTVFHTTKLLSKEREEIKGLTPASPLEGVEHTTNWSNVFDGVTVLDDRVAGEAVQLDVRALAILGIYFPARHLVVVDETGGCDIHIDAWDGNWRGGRWSSGHL